MGEYNAYRASMKTWVLCLVPMCEAKWGSACLSPQHWGSGDRWIPRACWPASLPSGESWVQWETCVKKTKNTNKNKPKKKKKKVEGDHRRHSVLHVASIATLLTCTPICTCTHMQSHMHMNTTSTFVDIIQVLKIRHQRVNLWWG